jgi:predicted nucleotidyltransferase
MSRGQLQLPPFAVLARALRDTTERLARELVTPTTRAPAWNELEWRVARATAAIQGTSALLANRLRWQGPAGWQEFLESQREFGLERERAVDQLLSRLDSALRDTSAAAVALKGSALRRLALYAPGERPMSDVDILVDAAGRERVAAAMAKLGYVPAYDTPRHTVYESGLKSAPVDFGEHPRNLHQIDVHEELNEELPVQKVDITACVRPALANAGLNAYPDRAALMTHLLLHAAGNLRVKSLRQVQLHDIALLAPTLDAADWRRLLEPGSWGLWWMLPPLRLIARYYPGTIPAAVIQDVQAAAGSLLRLGTARLTLTQVSLSNLRIAAFPGITWSHSLGEALRFARGRIVPSRQGQAEIDQLRAKMPVVDRVPWYGESHLVRILRWVFTRPPRVQTMITLHGVFGESAGKA